MKRMRAKDYELKASCRYGSKLEVVEKLIEKGANVNCKDGEGYTPLHCAVESECPGLVELLIKKGARLDAKTEEGFTPLHIAANFNMHNIIKMLLRAGANPLAKSHVHKTPRDLMPDKEAASCRMLMRAEKRRKG